MGGRPKKKTPDGKDLYDIPTMIEKINAYTDRCIHPGGRRKPVVPIALECFLENGWTKQRVYQLAQDNKALFDSIKRLVGYREIILERKAAKEEIDITFAIFSLKQLGWTDKVQQDITVQDKSTGQLLNVLAQLKDG